MSLTARVAGARVAMEAVAFAARTTGREDLADLVDGALDLLGTHPDDERARLLARDRKRKQRDILRDSARDVTRDNSVTSRVTIGGVRGGTTLSLNKDQILESERPENGHAEVTQDVTRDVTQAERYVNPTDTLTPELRETASLERVQDIEGAWKKYCGYYAGKFQHVAGKWQMWCVQEAKRERTERDKLSQSRPQAAPGTTNGGGETPGAHRARERQRDAEHARLKAEAVPAPLELATLLGGVGGKPPKPPPPEPPPSEPATGTKVAIRPELTDEEREQRRQEQIAAAHAMAEHDDK